MKLTIDNAYDLRDIFSNYDRDYFSLEGYDALIDFYDEIDPDMELDVIEICGDVVEYDASELKDVFGYLYTWEDWENDTDNISYDMDGNDFIELNRSYIKALIEKIDEKYIIIPLKHGSYLVFN